MPCRPFWGVARGVWSANTAALVGRNSATVLGLFPTSYFADLIALPAGWLFSGCGPFVAAGFFVAKVRPVLCVIFLWRLFFGICVGCVGGFCGGLYGGVAARRLGGHA